MELRGQTILITGASGFVGGHVARRLAESEGARVRALVRDPGRSSVAGLVHPSIQPVKGNVLDFDSVARACSGVSIVFHAAVDMRTTSTAVARATIIEGTRNVYEAARAAGARHFIHMSSLSVYYGVMHTDADEDVVLVPCGDLYCDAKIAAEHLLMNAPSGGPVVTVLRAAAVYGPGSPQWSLRPVEEAKRGRLFLPGGGHFPLPYVYIENLVDAVIAVARTESQQSRVYNILDGRTTYREFVEQLARLVGRRPRSLPMWVLPLAAWIGDGISRLTGRWVRLSRGLARAIAVAASGRRWRAASAEAARRDIGWVPRVDLPEGLRRTEAWLRENGYVA